MNALETWWAPWRLGLPGGWPVALLVCVLLGALGWYGSRRLGALPAGPRRLLRGLRLGSLLLAALVVLQPERLVEVREPRQGPVAVVLDVSASMGLPDGRNGSRLADALTLLRDVAREGEGEARFHLLDLEVRATRREALLDETPPATTARRTDLSGALGRWLAQAAGSADAPAAVLLLSDGADTEHAPLDALRAAAVPVHTVLLGGARTLRDRAIRSARVPPRVPLRDRAKVQVRLHQRPAEADERVRVRLWRGDRLLSEADATLDEQGEGEASLPFVLRTPGRVVLRVEVEPLDDDAVPENDVRWLLVEGRREQLRVLHLAGRPSWDVRFLRAFLKRDPSLQLVSFFILRTEGDDTNAAPDEMALIPFPTDELFRQHLDRFDVVILQNFDYEPYGIARYLPGLARHVRRGGGLVMVGGERTFERGNYADTPLQPLLPVELLPADRPASATLLTEPFEPTVAEGMSQHPLVALWPRDGAGWARLAPVDLLHRVAAVRPEAIVPLVHPRLRTARGEPAPVLALSTPGKGRVATLLTDGSWRWGMPSAARGADGAAHARFWDRLLRWAAADPRLEPCQLSLPEPRVALGTSFPVEVTARDAAFQPLRHAEARWLLLDEADEPLGDRPVTLDAEGHWKGRLTAPRRAGGVRLELHPAGDTPVRCQGWLLVERAGPDLLDPRPDPQRLAAIAQATGGRYLERPDALPSLDRLAREGAPLRAIRRSAPFRSWPVLGLLFALLTADWWLRRRRGLH